MQTTTSLLEQCRQLPGTVRLACEQAARSRYQRHYHPALPNRRQHMVVDAVMGLGVVLSLVAVLFITFVYQRSVQHQQIEFSVRPQTADVISGDTIVVAVDVHNRSNLALSNAYITIPATSSFVSDTQRVDIGTIKAGKLVELDLRGVVIGDVDSAARVHAVLHYQTNGFTEEQERFISEAVFVRSSHVTVSAEFPESLALQQPFRFTVTVRNASANTSFPNVIVLPTVPPGFEIVETQPAADPATNAWSFDSIGSLQEVVISGTARLTASLTGDAAVTFKVYAAPEGLPHLQDQLDLQLPVFIPKVSAVLERSPAVLVLGEEARFDVHIVNNEDFDLVDAQLHVHLPDTLFVIADTIAVADQAGYKEFRAATIQSGEPYVLSIYVTPRVDINAEQAFGNDPAGMRWHAEFHYRRETDGQLITVSLPEKLIPIASDLSLQASARYRGVEGETIGTGPWPLQPGQVSTVWVFFTVQNQINPLINGMVSGRFGDGVRPTGRQSVTAGQAVVVGDDGRFTWNVGDIADYKNAFDKRGLSAAIEVEVTTTGEDETAMTLMREGTVQAYDTVAQQTITSATATITVEQVIN